MSISKTQKFPSLFALKMLMLFLIILFERATGFIYPSSESGPQSLTLQGDASSSSEGIQLTTNRKDKAANGSSGRALYGEPVRLWDSTTGEEADFSTRFSFKITVETNISMGADGLAFFLAPYGTVIPPFSGGGLLALFNDSSRVDSSEHPVVAVEFDTYQNDWDPAYDPAYDHVGIDINSIISVTTAPAGRSNESYIADAWIGYNSSTKNFSVELNYTQSFGSPGKVILSRAVQLKTILPELVSVGFAATTGTAFEFHHIISWQFNSTEFTSKEPNRTVVNPGTREGKGSKNTIRVATLVTVSVSFVVLSLILFMWCWKKKNGKKDEESVVLEMTTDDDYESGTGPKKFTYSELARATNNFSDDGKLGEGGFGGVYKGILNDLKVEIAVKKISPKSKQGKKEFISEVKIISQLRHRNLVQLLGWCHEQGELLLVYEFLYNGSLDYHLFRGRSMISWEVRYKIALGLASGLLYLHEGWEQAVVHRDIKCSNIMLDSNFNAKLGDFGLARFADHDVGLKTTRVVGTMGYLAPECMVTGKAGKESDIYSFGVVALEIACGRRVVEPDEEFSKVGLVAWVWKLYGSGTLIEAVDTKLCNDFDDHEIERLMVVGLWCANMDHALRPSIKQAISVLNFEAPLPDLPFKMSVPTHFMLPNEEFGVSYASSSSNSGTRRNQSRGQYYSDATGSSNFTTSTKFSSSTSLLHTGPR
ncbi:non-specific serine/threonine protein kinase [Ranunculus cassubicifolius]